jgi:signal transduction histidine kinase
MFVLLGNEAKR